MRSQSAPAVIAEDPARLDNPILDTFLDYWNARRGAGGMPSRADINPADLKSFLGWLCFVEALPGYDDFRFRLIGSRVADYFLSEVTGQTVREAYAAARASEAETHAVLWILRKTCAAHHPMRVTGDSGDWRGHPYPDYDALYLPLSEDGVKANQVMCGFTFNYRAFQSTRAIGVMTKRG
jgi:hypothetical protein